MKKLLFALLAPLCFGLVSAQTITIWNTGDDNSAAVLGAATELFEESHPGVTINIQVQSWNDAHAKVLSAAVSGTGPDIITGGLSWGIEFGELGGMVDLKEAAPDVVSKIEGLVQPGVYKSVVPPSGEVYGVPLDLTTFMMVYRPDLLEAASAANPPQTWDELTTALTDLGNKGFAIAWGSADWLGFYNFLYQAGGTLYDEGCTTATINSPEGVQAAEFFASLYNTYGTPVEADLEAGLDNGDYALGYSGNWLINLGVGRPELAKKVAYAPIAAGPSGKNTAFIGGSVIGIMANSQNVDLAAEFIGTLYDSEVVQAMGAVSATQGGLRIPPVVEFVKQIETNNQDALDALVAQLEDAAGPPNCSGWEEAANTVTNQLQEIIFNGADVQGALDKAAEEMNSKLN